MVTALGGDVASTWDGLIAGRSGIGPITAFDPSRVASRIAGEVPDFDPSAVLDRKEQRRNDRYTQLALVATREALADAGLPERLDGLARRADRDHPGDRDRRRPHVRRAGRDLRRRRGPTGSARSSSPWRSPTSRPARPPSSSAPWVPTSRSRRPAPRAATRSARRGRSIRRGDADVMIAGSSEAGINEVLVGGFAAMRALSTRNDDPAAASRPFDRGRDGFVIGEGAGVVILEELEHARARGARAARRAGRLRRLGRRPPHHAPRARRSRRRPGRRPGAGEGRPVGGRRGARQRPRDLHARGRPDRAGDAPRRSSARGPARSASRPTRACSATPWARRAPSRPRSRS